MTNFFKPGKRLSVRAIDNSFIVDIEPDYSQLNPISGGGGGEAVQKACPDLQSLCNLILETLTNSAQLVQDRDKNEAIRTAQEQIQKLTKENQELLEKVTDYESGPKEPAPEIETVEA